MLLLRKGVPDMPVLESTDNNSPRSALRYRPLEETARSKRSIVTTAAHPVVAQRASRVRPRPADDDLISEWKRGDEEEIDSTPAPIRVTNPPVRRSGNSKPGKTVTKTTDQQPVVSRRAGLRAHPLLLLSLGMLAMFALWTLLTAGLNWWNDTMDFLHYGYPRTSQADAVVGHSDSLHTPTHFTVINLHGHIDIIEFPGGDESHARVYRGPQLLGSDADKAPVTLKFADVTGDRQPDMLVFFQSSWIVFINDKGSFRPPTFQEHQEAGQYLATHSQ